MNNPAHQADIAARERLIFGKPPRLQPIDRARVAEAAKRNAAALRSAVSGSHVDPESIPLERIPDVIFTMLRYPELWERICGLSMHLLSGGLLSARDRELAVLRVGWLCQAPFEWGEHVKQAKNAGITSAEIEQITVGSAAPGWSEHDRALMRAVEELHSDSMVADSTWDTLSTRLDANQLFELTVLVGQFHTVAFFQNSLRLPLGEGNIGLAAR